MGIILVHENSFHTGKDRGAAAPELIHKPVIAPFQFLPDEAVVPDIPLPFFRRFGEIFKFYRKFLAVNSHQHIEFAGLRVFASGRLYAELDAGIPVIDPRLKPGPASGQHLFGMEPGRNKTSGH